MGKVAAVVLVVAVLTGPLRADDRAMRELAILNRGLQVQIEAIRSQIDALREQLVAAQRENKTLRELLVRNGVDVEGELARRPETQPDAIAESDLIFESPESLAEYLRANYRRRVQPNMTRLQVEAGRDEFDRWLADGGLLLVPVTWVLRIEDAWRAEQDDKIVLHYASDRQRLMEGVAVQPASPADILRLRCERLKEIQKARQAFYERKVKEMSKASPGEKALAEAAMRQAHDAAVRANVEARQAEARYLSHKRMGRAASQPAEASHRIMIHGVGGREQTVELSVFCHEQDVGRLLAAPKGAMIKVRGWLTDIALAERVATVGLRVDHAEVLAVNVKSPPPPPVSGESEG